MPNVSRMETVSLAILVTVALITFYDAGKLSGKRLRSEGVGRKKSSRFRATLCMCVRLQRDTYDMMYP